MQEARKSGFCPIHLQFLADQREDSPAQLAEQEHPGPYDDNAPQYDDDLKGSDDDMEWKPPSDGSSDSNASSSAQGLPAEEADDSDVSSDSSSDDDPDRDAARRLEHDDLVADQEYLAQLLAELSVTGSSLGTGPRGPDTHDHSGSSNGPEPVRNIFTGEP